MPRPIKKLPSLSNVSAGATATLNCPIGFTYDRIELEFTGVTLAEMTNIEVLVDGKVIQSYASGTQVEQINDYYGRAKTAGFLSLWFNRPEMDNVGQERVTGIGTQGVQTLQVRLDIDAGAAGPVISAHAQQSEPQPLGLITKIKRFQFNSAVSGDFEIDSIPRGPRILAAHFMKSDVDNIEVEVDSFKLTEGSKALLQHLQLQSGRVPVAAFTSVDYHQEGDIAQVLATTKKLTQGSQVEVPVDDLRFRLTLGSAGAVPVVVEYLDGFAGI